MKLPEPATARTIYFIGVTTGQSSIMRVYPRWAQALGLNDTVIKGIDIGIHAPGEDYRQMVDFIKKDPLSMGALVTTHKIDLYNACKDMFDYLDGYAQLFGELSSISKRDGRLEGYAKDPISSGLALKSFVPENFWREHWGELLILGAGGSALSIAANLIDKRNGENLPARLTVCNRSLPRLEEMERIDKLVNPDLPARYLLTPEPELSDKALAELSQYSLIVNATGLGKDRPGSPLTGRCVYPRNSIVWELNYRGTLEFMHDAQAQREEKNLTVEDGWTYFIHGWTQVVAEVFHIDITGERLALCDRIARETR